VQSFTRQTLSVVHIVFVSVLLLYTHVHGTTHPPSVQRVFTCCGARRVGVSPMPHRTLYAVHAIIQPGVLTAVISVDRTPEGRLTGVSPGTGWSDSDGRQGAIDGLITTI
jgi:hypothetical protein